MPRLSVEDRLLRGDRLRMGFTHRGRMWWFENPYQIVSDQRVTRLRAQGSNIPLIEGGDSLFGLPGNSQTWLAVKGGTQ